MAKIIYDASKGFWQGLPARDLTQAEWDEVSPENQKTLLASGMYKMESRPIYKEPAKKDIKILEAEAKARIRIIQLRAKLNKN